VLLQTVQDGYEKKMTGTSMDIKSALYIYLHTVRSQLYGNVTRCMTRFNLLLVIRASCHYQLLFQYYRHHTDWLIHGELKTSVISGLELQVHLQTVVHSWGPRAASLHFSTCHTVCGLY
jgi:hypothetical protein